MVNKKKVLIDANVFIALVYPTDALNNKAEDIFANLTDTDAYFFTNTYIIAETYTVLLKRSKRSDLVAFLKRNIFENPLIRLKVFDRINQWEKNIIHLMMEQNKFKGEFLSFTDSSLIIQARKQKISTIFTFNETFMQFKNEFEILGV